jgi:hypothetical protein
MKNNLININNKTITLPPSFSEKNALSSLGTISQLTKNQNNVSINFSAVEWADPLSLMMLACIIANNNKNYNTQFKIIFDDHKEKNNYAFLKFLANQGFIDIFGKQASLIWKGDKSTSQELKNVFSVFPQDTNLRNADCIFAKLAQIETIKNGNLQEYVEALINEAKARAINSVFRSNSYVRDRLVQKLRKIFFELISNCMDHAYDSMNGFFSLYVRVRGGRPQIVSEADRWDHLFMKEKMDYVPAIKGLELNPFSDWLEVFVCDAGKGLLDCTPEVGQNILE